MMPNVVPDVEVEMAELTVPGTVPVWAWHASRLVASRRSTRMRRRCRSRPWKCPQERSARCWQPASTRACSPPHWARTRRRRRRGSGTAPRGRRRSRRSCWRWPGCWTSRCCRTCTGSPPGRWRGRSRRRRSRTSWCLGEGRTHQPGKRSERHAACRGGDWAPGKHVQMLLGPPLV